MSPSLFPLLSVCPAHPGSCASMGKGGFTSGRRVSEWPVGLAGMRLPRGPAVQMLHSGVILGTQGLGQCSFGGDAEPLWGLRLEEESLGTSSVSPVFSAIWLCFRVLKQSHKALPLPTCAGITSVHHHFGFTLSEYGCVQWVCTQESRYPHSPDKGVRCPRAGVTGSCELLCVDAGDLTPFRSSAHF